MGILSDHDEQIITHEGTLARKLDVTQPQIVDVTDTQVTLSNIRCYDADGEVFEHYPLVNVARIPREYPTWSAHYPTLSHFGNPNCFLPSAALSCAVLAQLFINRGNKACRQILQQYDSPMGGLGLHTTNTLIDWETQKLIHYPQYPDFINTRFINDAAVVSVPAEINANAPRTELYFDATQLANCGGGISLERVLEQPKLQRFVHQLTGLEDPTVLFGLGKFCEKPIQVYAQPEYKKNAVARIGGFNNVTNDFGLVLYPYSTNAGAIRSVSVSKKEE